MKVTFNIRTRNLIRVTPENSDPLKNHSVWNIFVSFVETTQKIDKSQTDNLTSIYFNSVHTYIHTYINFIEVSGSLAMDS